MNLLQCALLPAIFLFGQHFPIGSEPLLKTDFTKNPVASGWELRGNGDEPFDGGWVEASGTPVQRCLVVRSGYWQTPAIPIEPFHFYRFDFTSKAEKGGLWSAVFFDADGKEMIADVYDSIDGSPDWQPRTFCIRRRGGSARPPLLSRLWPAALGESRRIGGGRFGRSRQVGRRDHGSESGARTTPRRRIVVPGCRKP